MMAGEDKSSPLPWKNGIYHSRAMPSMLYEVNGEHIMMYPASGKPSGIKDNPMAHGTWKCGDFGEVHPEVGKETGAKRNNVEMIAWGGMMKIPMVASEDKEHLTFYGMSHCVDIMDWLSDEALAEFIATGDPHDDLPHPYKVQPEYQGKLVWLSGCPGLGKSTSAMLLGRNAGYVYYEADSFMNHMNPYVSTNVDEPSLAMMSQKFLKGIPQERIDCVATGLNPFMDFIEGREYDLEKVCGFYSAMSKDIANEQKRIGGDFVIAQAVPTRKIRDFIRNQMGENLIFVVLHMTKEDQMERIIKRHGDANENLVEKMTKCHEVFEPAEDDEKNAIHCLITKDMSRDEVVEKIVQLLKDHSK